MEVSAYKNLALRFDDTLDEWRWTRDKIAWTREMTGKIPADHRQIRTFFAFLNEHVVGKPYDMRCLAGVRYDLGTHDYKKWNCSDFIYLGFLHAGIVAVDPPGLWHITPRDLMLLIGAMGVLKEA